VSGGAGRNTNFRTPDEVINDIKTHDRLDVHMMLINGRKVVPVWVHQQDFERVDEDNVIDEDKWKIYTETLLRIKEDPDMIIVNPRQLYEMYLVAGSSTEIDEGVPL